ncbi:MAG: hemolysin family protein [Armatimonadota bacterium]
MAVAVWLILIAASLVGIFVLWLAEASLLSVSHHELRRAARRGERAARLVLAISERADFLSVVIVGVNTLVLIISNLMTHVVAHYFGSEAEGPKTVAHLAMLVCILVVGELWPKTYGSLRPGPSARAIAGVMAALIRLLGPMVVLMTWISNGVMRLFGISPRHQFHFVTAEEIRAAADLGEQEGTVEPEEGEMLDSVMELGERTVRDIMVPRVDVMALPADATLEQLVEAAVESGFSRIPIYEGSIDHIVGIVYVNDILANLSRGERDTPLSEVARTPLLAPETKRLDEMLAELRQQKVHIAIVIDEFGGTAGLVTIEDILEELVGEIEDEHDLPETDILSLGSGEAIVTGRTRVEDLQEHLGIELPTEWHGTVSGFLTSLAGRVPEEGEVLFMGDVRFEVVESNDQHVERLRVIAPTHQEAER